MVKCLPAVRETRVLSLGWEDPLEKEMETHSSILAWRIPWTEEPGRLQSMWSQGVGRDWATSLSLWEKHQLNSSSIVAGAAAAALDYELHRNRPELTGSFNYWTSFFSFSFPPTFSQYLGFPGLLFLPAKPLSSLLFHITPQCGWALGECSVRLLMCSFSQPKHWPPSLCPQHHQTIQQYMVTLENLLFTAELDPHILAVFQQFCALQAWAPPSPVETLKDLSLSYFWLFECLLSCSFLSLSKRKRERTVKKYGIDYP